MKTKSRHIIILVITFLFGGIEIAKSQGVVADVHGTYLALNSYAGRTLEVGYTVRLQLRTNNLDIRNWSLSTRVTSPIVNLEGKMLDPSRVSIRFNGTAGDAPSLSQLGLNKTPIPLSFAEMPVVTNARVPIFHGPNRYYSEWVFNFDVIVAGGSYLQALKSWSNYAMNLLFFLKDSRGNVISQDDYTMQMQLYPEDTPPFEPTYGIVVNSNARNGLLEFKSINDYVNGVSQTYQNGISIVSNTPYAVTVRTLSLALEAPGNSIPVNVVNLAIEDPRGSTGGTVALSNSSQTVFNGINSNTLPRSFNLRYFTKPNDERLFQTKPANYSTTLVFTLMPQ